MTTQIPLTTDVPDLEWHETVCKTILCIRDVIARNGWTSGELFEEGPYLLGDVLLHESRVCIGGALNLHLYGHPRPPQSLEDPDTNRLSDAVLARLEQAVKNTGSVNHDLPADAEGFVTYFNDHVCETQDQALAFLEEAAA